MEKSLLLYIALNFCHFLADSPPLSLPFIEAKKYGRPIFPIFAHGGVHGALMGLCLLFFMPICSLWGLLSLFQQISHTIIDTLKGRLRKWIPVTEDNTKKWYWIIMMFDQFLHQCVIALMVYIVLTFTK